GSDKPVLASGMSDFRKGEDNTFSAVFSRADENMYWHKRKLKQVSNAKYGMRNDIYEMFYRSKDCSLVEMLNNSSCDEIVEVDLNRDSFRQFYYIENKYISAPKITSYSALYEFCCKELVHPDDKEEYAYQLNPDRFFQRISKNKIPNFDFIHVRYKLQDGSYRYVEQCVIAGEENELAPGVFRIYIFDINNLKMRMAGNETGNIKPFMKQRNSLTGLYVENEFFPRGETLVKEKGNEGLCLISIDIEHFRFFDEWYGREKGDEFLAGIGKILLKEEEETGGVAGYFSYDDFAIICPKDDKRILALYEKIRGLVGEFGLSVGFQPAFGITKLEEGVRVVDAFDRANIALGRAKKDIRSRISYYESSAHDDEEAEYRVLSDFVDAMKNDEFTFYLQPQCVISSGKIVGSEALVRWKKKSGKIIPPGDYIPLLEKYGFIVDLDQMLWGKVAKWLRQLIDEGITPLPVSVNVSRTDIFSLDIASIFKNLARKYNLPHELLKIEITESAYSETTTKMADLAKKLRNDGFMVLMDDFGSGYSSLNMLNTLEVDVIKLDGGFLRLKGSAYDRGISIIESVVNMSRNIALPIIVEGVETKSQSDFLQSLGCHYAQGYYFYRPMPIKDFEALLKNEDGLDRNGIVASSNEQFRLHEFLDENIYSDSMLNNIIGPVAFYALKADGDVDIVRFNEQFCDAVGIKEFHERLGAVQNYMPKEDAVILRKALVKAISDRLVGSNAVLRFYKPGGVISYFKIHFYHIGKKENNDLFYGSATDVSPLAILKEEFDIVSHMSIDSLILISKKYDKWVYRVASHGLSNALGIGPEQLEKELNNGAFAKRVSHKEDLAGFMKLAAEKSEKHENFNASFHVRPKTGKSVLLKLEFFYVGDKSDNVLYVLRSSIADSPINA
ncbi:MAG: GGDEF domain-containing protein, partial [Bacilli bacterium]|nr:GGDEF domain-containing protein [Bacilli bacterium]